MYIYIYTGVYIYIHLYIGNLFNYSDIWVIVVTVDGMFHGRGTIPTFGTGFQPAVIFGSIPSQILCASLSNVHRSGLFGPGDFDPSYPDYSRVKSRIVIKNHHHHHHHHHHQ